MRGGLTRHAAVAGLVVVAALVVGAAPAWASPGDASARGVALDLSLVGRDAVSAGPFAAADANGPTAGTLAAVHLPDVLSTGVITATASRDDKTGGVASRASTADVRLDLLRTVTGGMSAELVEAECAATQKGLTGKSRLVGLDLGRLGDLDLDPHPGPDLEPAPNTAVDLDLLGVDVAKVVFNEQMRGTDGSLTVNAVRLTLTGGVPGTADLVLSSATCGPAGLPTAMASAAGLWIGLGLLTAFGVPVGAVALRRRHELGTV
ncbi:choice-of-anchor P family protein [Actinosynnema sp. NPDC050801]|uniref:choice-of-anchor P family protein n=1 Tax=unclassified Actinosynnema TaxID=2637065 RepID=UPI0033EB70F6